ncbi:hypothetical protein [Nonomuraea sp. NPDC048916]|uniref:hypothetical protein n=1 Tax=Nonomuraea sp. NPDC048916 TaxID=3154232 RepID=UPI00340F76E4
MTPDEEPRLEPSTIIRTYRLEGPIEVARWHLPTSGEAAEKVGQVGQIGDTVGLAGPPAEKAGAPGPATETLALAGLRSMADGEQRGLPRLNLRRARPRHAMVHMTHSLAASYLKDAGLRYKSSGGCTNRWVRTCTSLDSVRTNTIARVIQLKRESGCPIVVTGGTEAGHAPGRYSHGQGYKLDISKNACVDRYISRNHQSVGNRGDGSTLYRSASGTVFANESDHWDIMFR